MGKELYLVKDGTIGTIYLNRTAKKNAFTLEMFKQLAILLQEVEVDEEIKVLVLRGVDDTAFSAGGDISEFLQNRFSTEKAKEYNDTALDTIELLYRLSKPTIALIRKLAIGGGLELSLACDFRFASSDSVFGVPASNLGIIYNLTSTKRIIEAVGVGQAKKLLYTGKTIRAEEAYRIGLIDDHFSGEEVESVVYSFASDLAKQSTVSVRGSKKVIQAIVDGHIEEDERLSSIILESFSARDYQEGIQAFIEKRKPRF